MTSMTLSRWGNCLALRIPKRILEENHWQAGDQFECRFDAGEMRLKKIRQVKKYDIEEILEGAENMPREDIIGWGAPVGRETW